MVLRKNISIFMIIFLIFSFIVPAQAVDNKIIIKLVDDKNEITTKHIEKISIQAINKENEEKTFNIVLALMDYKGKVINYIASEELLNSKESTHIKAYTKILPEADKVMVFAWDNLDDRNLISNKIEIPVTDGDIAEQIISIDNIDIQISQWSEYHLPKEISAKVNTGVTKKIPVKWNIDMVDTSKSGKFVIEGTVIGYNEEKVILNLNIKAIEKIISVQDLNISIDQGDEFELPTTVLATMNSGSKVSIPVKWNADKVDTSIEGEYTFEGLVDGYNSKVKLKLVIEKMDLNEVIEFINAEMEDVIRDEIDKTNEEDILKEDLLKITELYLPYSLDSDFNINDLRHLKNLEVLDLSFYSYNFDLKPLSNLTKLKTLNLFGNKIKDLNSLTRLTNLSELNLGTNKISTIEALKGLTSLNKLQLNGNEIVNIKPICNLNNLKSLKLGGNLITDYTPTASYYDKLTEKDFELTILLADDNNVINYSLSIGDKLILPYGVKLSNGKVVFVDWDQQEIIGSNNGIKKIKGKTIDSHNEIYFECIIGEIEEDRVIKFPDLNLEKAIRIAIDKKKGDIYYNDVKSLKNLEALASGISNLDGIENLKGLERLGLWGNNVETSQLKYLKNLNNLVSLDLAMNKLTYIPGNAFENMSKLEELVLDENQIIELDKDAFKGLDNLEDLLIEENMISNIDCVEGLLNLKRLFIRYNKIVDINAVKNLTNLTDFWANNNKISEVSVLDNLTDLNWIQLEKNNISDISSLRNLSKTKRLNINDNEIKNIDIVSNMPNLEWLQAKNNQIESIDCLNELVGLSILDLKGNSIEDIQGLSKLENLTQLYLSGNKITDFSPIENFYHKIKATDFELN